MKIETMLNLFSFKQKTRTIYWRIYSRRTDTNKNVTALNWLMQTYELKPARIVCIYMLCTKERKNEKSCQVIADHFRWHKMHFFCCLPFGCFFSLVLWCASCRTNIWMCALSKLSHLSFALRIFLFHYQSMLHIRVMSLGLSLSVNAFPVLCVHRSIIAQLIEWLGIFTCM